MRSSKAEKIALWIVLVAFTVSATGASAFNNPPIYYEPGSADALFSVENNTEVTNPQLRLSSLYQDRKTYDLNYSSNKSRYSANISLNQAKGVYFYRFTSRNESFPEGHLSFIAGDPNETVFQRGLNFQNNISDWNQTSNSACDLTSDFSCEYENHQAERMISAVQYYRTTSNKTYLKRALNFSSRPYSDSLRGRCDDFNCSSDGDTEDPLIVPSAVRQGALIEGLWTVYGISNNSTVKELAEGYSQGHPVQCDVWNSDYNCTTGWSQGRMAMGYWTAHKVTGNETYREKAENLMTYEFDHPLYGKALIEGYKITGNDTYRERAKSLAKNISCSNCSNFMKKEFYWNGFSSTDEYGFYRNAYKDINRSCLDNVNSTCSYPINQSRASKTLLQRYLGFQNDSKNIFNGRVDEKDKVGDPVHLAVDYSGMIENTTILYRKVGENWKTCEPGWFGECTITENDTLKQGVYEYKFETQNLSFPSNGTLRFALNSGNDELLNQSRDFADTGMTTLPDGEYCDLSDDTLACDDEGYQAKMLSGYTKVFADVKEHLEELYNLFNGPYIDFKGADAKCDPAEGDFNCENGGYADSSGSYKQGSLIKSLFETYRVTENGTVFERALNYTKGSAEDCDVWSKDFQCDTERGQSAMIDGYLTAYQVTGNETYLNISENLSEAITENESSRPVASSLWKASSLLNSTNLSQKAENRTQNFEDRCSDSSCSAAYYTDSLELAHNAFLYGNNDTYSDQYRNLLDSTTSFGECGPYKEDYNCNTPDTQGEMISLFRKAYYTAPVKYNITTSFQLSEENVVEDQSFDAQCSVENNFEDRNLTEVELTLDISSNLSTSESKIHEVGNLTVNDSAEKTWSIKADSKGLHETHCTITSSKILEKTLVEKISVSEKEETEEETDDSSSSSGGSSGGSFIPPPKYTPEKIHYPLNSVNWSEEKLAEEGINTSRNEFRFNSSCLSAKRTLEKNNSSLEVNYSCGREQNILIIDKLPNSSIEDSRTEKFENISNSSLNINYSYKSSKDLWNKPTVLFYEKIELKMNSSLENITLEGNTTLLSADLNMPTRCTIKRNNTIVEKLHTDKINQTIALREGTNLIEVKCGEESERYTLEHEVEKEKDEDNIGLAKLLPYAIGTFSLFTVFLSSFFYRKKILKTKNKILFKWYFRKFQKALDDDSVEKSVKTYSKLSDYTDGDLPKSLLNSNTQLMRGLRVYILMDLVESGIDEGVPLPPDKIEELVMNYLENTDNEELCRIINQKLEEISQ